MADLGSAISGAYLSSVATPRLRRGLRPRVVVARLRVMVRLRNLAFAAALIAPIVAQQWQVVPPTTRMGAGMAYDAIRSRTVLFGGGIPFSQSPRDETFEFDGARWRSSDSVVVPPARWSSAMAFDSVRGRTILFGGYDFPQVYHAFDDTWEYDGSVWVRGALTSPPARPAPRHGHALAFDARRGRAVMFGGEVDGERAGDTWEYDGVLWTRTFTAHQPPARSGHGLVYDDARQRIVLFGGAITNGRTLTNDTWEYDGVDWTQVAIAAPPGARKDAQMATTGVAAAPRCSAGTRRATPLRSTTPRSTTASAGWRCRSRPAPTLAIKEGSSLTARAAAACCSGGCPSRG